MSCSILFSHPIPLLPASQKMTVASPFFFRMGQTSWCVLLECWWAGKQHILGSDLVMWHVTQLYDTRRQQWRSTRVCSHPEWPNSFWSENQDDLQTKRKSWTIFLLKPYKVTHSVFAYSHTFQKNIVVASLPFLNTKKDDAWISVHIIIFHFPWVS